VFPWLGEDGTQSETTGSANVRDAKPTEVIFGIVLNEEMYEAAAAEVAVHAASNERLYLTWKAGLIETRNRA
jgi:hypothetical protein